MKQIVLSLFLFLSLSLQAQTEGRDTLMNDSLQADSVVPAQPSAFKRAIKKFMNFSDFDTLYISPNRYNYALMTTHFSNFEYYSVTSNLPQPQKLSFSPNHITKQDCTLAGDGFFWDGPQTWTIFTGKRTGGTKEQNLT